MARPCLPSSSMAGNLVLYCGVLRSSSMIWSTLSLFCHLAHAHAPRSARPKAPRKPLIWAIAEASEEIMAPGVVGSGLVAPVLAGEAGPVEGAPARGRTVSPPRNGTSVPAGGGVVVGAPVSVAIRRLPGAARARWSAAPRTG